LFFAPGLAPCEAADLRFAENRDGGRRCVSKRPGESYFFFFGARLPFLRAFESAMAIACLRLFTLPRRPPLPLLAVPLL
jgi:hypothetical protein